MTRFQRGHREGGESRVAGRAALGYKLFAGGAEYRERTDKAQFVIRIAAEHLAHRRNRSGDAPPECDALTVWRPGRSTDGAGRTAVAASVIDARIRTVLSDIADVAGSKR